MSDKRGLKNDLEAMDTERKYKKYLEMDRLNTCNVDNKWFVPSTVLLHSFAVSVQWNAHILLCAESVTSIG
jgi:hypothetical protein